MIEFLASVDPVSLPLLAVLAFSLSLYPVGLMLGSPCSPCCGCAACTEGVLPNTVTVTLSGLPDTKPGPDLLSMSIQGCTGFGATAVARAPSGDGPPGPITSVEVTNGGSGYATIARVEPVVTATIEAEGEGVELEVTLNEDADFCKLPYWEVQSVKVTKGGSGYSLNDSIVFTAAEGDVTLFDAFAQVTEIDAAEPTLTFETLEDRGSGAVLAAVLDQTSFDPDRWSIDSVTVTNGGTGYHDGDPVTVAAAAGLVEASSASLTIRTERDEPAFTIASQGGSDFEIKVASRGTTPETWEIDEVIVTNGGSGYSDGQSLTLGFVGNVIEEFGAFLVVKTIRTEPTLTASPSSGGEGAVFTIAVSKTGSDPDVWSAVSVDVTAPGTGYTNGDFWLIEASSGTTTAAGSATATVDEDGGLVSLSIDFGGQFFFDTGEIDEVDLPFGGGSYFDDTGIIDSVDVNFGGSYYQTTGEVVEVTVSSGGQYYRENPAGEPYLDDVTVTVFDGLPSDGSGATFTAVIDDDPDSATFGEITAITVTNGGDGYLEFENIQVCCGEFYNGRPIVLRRGGVPAEPGESALGTYSIGGTFPSGTFPGPYRCVYEHRFCGVGNNFRKRGSLAINYSGADNPITVELRAERFSTTSNPGSFHECTAGDSFSNSPRFLSFSGGIENCSEFSFEATSEDGVTATVVAGGDYDPGDGYAGIDSCHICCQGLDEVPEEISTSWSPAAGAEFVAPAGDYVLVKNFAPNINTQSSSLDGEIQWASGVESLAVRIKTCYSGLNGNGVSPDLSETPGECNDCYRSCAVFAFTNGPTFGSIVASPADCDSCDPVPVCYPPSGAYVIPERGTLTVQ